MDKKINPTAPSDAGAASCVDDGHDGAGPLQPATTTDSSTNPTACAWIRRSKEGRDWERRAAVRFHPPDLRRACTPMRSSCASACAPAGSSTSAWWGPMRSRRPVARNGAVSLSEDGRTFVKQGPVARRLDGHLVGSKRGCCRITSASFMRKKMTDLPDNGRAIRAVNPESGLRPSGWTDRIALIPRPATVRIWWRGISYQVRRVWVERAPRLSGGSNLQELAICIGARRQHRSNMFGVPATLIFSPASARLASIWSRAAPSALGRCAGCPHMPRAHAGKLSVSQGTLERRPTSASRPARLIWRKKWHGRLRRGPARRAGRSPSSRSRGAARPRRLSPYYRMVHAPTLMRLVHRADPLRAKIRIAPGRATSSRP
jgi:hypothetical protein